MASYQSTGKSVSEILAERYAEIFKERFADIDANGWTKPWISASPCPAQNIGGHIYEGGNQFFLSLITCAKGWEHPLFLTDNQCDKLGLLIKKGEHPFPIACVKTWYKDTSESKRPFLSPEAYYRLSDDQKEGYEKREKLLYYKGYNISQTDFSEKLPERMQQISDRYAAVAAVQKDASIPEIDKMLSEQSWLCPVKEISSSKAFFSPSEDHIVIPKREQFPDRSCFYGTLYHEMTHSTGTEDRLNRDMGRFFGSEGYAREELVAELSSAILCTKSGISSSISEDNLQYLKNWTEVIGNDPKILTTIISDATKAADLIEKHIGLNLRPAIDLSEIAKDLRKEEKNESKSEERFKSQDNEESRQIGQRQQHCR